MHPENANEVFVHTSAKKVEFYGLLTETFGEEAHLYVDTAYEALTLIEANAPGALARAMSEGLYGLYKNGSLVLPNQLNEKLEDDDVLQIIPVVAGAELISFVIWAIVGIIIGVGLSYLLAPGKPKNTSTDAISFQGAINSTKEGTMVPIALGTSRVGSVVPSAERRLARAQFSFGNFGANSTWIPGNFLDNAPSFEGVNTSLTSRQTHVLSEGPVEGLVDGAEGILFNDTQLLNSDGSSNFDNVRYEFSDGDDPAPALSLITDTASELNPAVETELKDTDQIIRTLAPDLDVVRVLLRTPAFFKTNKKGKDRSIEATVKIESRETGVGGAWTTEKLYRIIGIIKKERFFEYEIRLDSSKQYDIAVSRTVAKSTENTTQDSLFFANLVQIKNQRIRYDGSAVANLEYNNESFGGVNPEIEFILAGLKVKVPTNYDPVARTYTGVWDGSYKINHTDNPAWLIQHVMDNRRYGLGEFLAQHFSGTDTYSLAQFCDVMVDDGAGGTEPRYTLNTVLKEREKAMVSLRQLASAFRGSVAWDGDKIQYVYDQARAVSHVFTDANVIGGDFGYAGVESRSRVNSTIVSFQDKNNRYRDDQRSYVDNARRRVEGLNEAEFESLSTSPGQALRQAKFTVLNATGDVLQFKAAEEAGRLLPGDLIAVYDNKRMGRDQGGRLGVGSTSTSIVLDRDFEIESGKTYTISCTMPDNKGNVQVRTVTTAPGTTNVLAVSSAFAQAPAAQSVWGITASDLSPSFYVIQERSHIGNGIYRISATEYFDGRFDVIETGFDIDPTNVTALPRKNSVGSPSNIVFNEVPYLDNNIAKGDLHIGWADAEDAIGYDVRYSIEGAAFTQLVSGTRSTTALIKNLEFANYTVQVRARSETAISPWVSADVNFDGVNAFQTQPSVSGLELFGQGNDTEFRNQNAKFVWRLQSPVAFSEDFGSEDFGADSNDVDPFFKHFEVRILDAGTNVVRRTEIITTNQYEYTLERNLEDGGTNRAFRIEVVKVDIFNRITNPATLEVSNPQIEKITSAALDAGTGVMILNYSVPAGTDWAGTKVYVSDMSGFTPGPANEVQDVRSSTIPIKADPGSTQYVKFAAYDTFGTDGLNYSDELTIQIPSADALALLSYMVPQYADMAGLDAADFDVERGSVSLSDTLSYVGNQSLRFDADLFGPQRTWLTDDRVNNKNVSLPAGRRWLLTGWFRTVSANPANAGLRCVFLGNLGTETLNTGTGQALIGANVWDRITFEVDLTGNTESAFSIGIETQIGTGTADLYMDAFSLFDVTLLPQYDESNPPPVVFVPSLGAGVPVDGKDGKPGLPGASTVHTYSDLALNGPPVGNGQYAFSTGTSAEPFAGTNTWAEITQAGAIDSLWINANDKDGVGRGSYIASRTDGEVITWLQSRGRWAEFRISSTPVLVNNYYVFSVALVEFDETEGNQDVDAAANVNVELRWSGAQDGDDGDDGDDGITVDLPGIQTRGISTNVVVKKNLTHLENPSDPAATGEYFISAGTLLLPDGSTRTFANNTDLITPFESTAAPLAIEKYNFMHFVCSGATPSDARFGFAADSMDRFEQGHFTMIVDFTASPLVYFAVDNLNNVQAFTPLDTDYVLGAGYKKNGEAGGITHYTSYTTKVSDVFATEGAVLGDNLRDSDDTVLDDIDLKNDNLVLSEFSAVNFNPNFQMPREHAEGHGPAGWFSSNNSASSLPTYTNYPNDKDFVRIPFNKNMANNAFRVNTSTKYEVLALVKADAGTMLPAVRIQELDSDFAQGKSVVGWEFVTTGREAQVVQATRSKTIKAQSVGSSAWVLLFGDYIPTVTAKWASIDIWTGNQGSAPLSVDYALVYEKSSLGAVIGETLMLPDGTVIEEEDISNSLVLNHNEIKGVEYVNHASGVSPANTQDRPWIIKDNDDNELSRLTIRSTVNQSTGVITLSVISPGTGMAHSFPDGNIGTNLRVNLTYTHAATGKTKSHSMFYFILNIGGGVGK